MSRGTTLRNVRISDVLWDAALRRAKAEGRSVSDIIREHLELWVRTGVSSSSSV